MSDARAVAACGLAVTFALAAPLASQDAAILRARVARLTLAVVASRREAARADSLIRSRVVSGLDTVRVGTLVLLTPSSLARVVREAGERVWAQAAPFYGSETRRFARFRFYLLPLERAAGFQPADGFVAGVIEPVTVDHLVASVRQLTGSVFGGSSWIGGFVSEEHPERLRREAYLELVTAPALSARECLLGDLQECARAFDLPPNVDHVLDWYDAEERRQLVSLTYPWTQRDPEVVACVRDRLDAACVNQLRTRRSPGVPPPLTIVSRLSLLHTALRLGGSGAFHRWISDTTQRVEDRLSAAAGASRDSLLRAWRVEILAARPNTVSITGPAAWAALAWCLAFAYAGFRSSRWR